MTTGNTLVMGRAALCASQWAKRTTWTIC